MQRRRKAFSRLFVAALGAVVLISESYWDARGMIVGDLLFLIGLVLVGVATVGRLWCGLYIAGYKTNTLITVGPYSVCRNPLYLFSLLGGIGLGLANETVTLALVIAAAFLSYYPFVIGAEEKNLLRIHGVDFDRYVANTPRLCPSWNRLREPEEYTVRPRAFRRAIFDAMLFVWMAGVLELVEALHAHHVLPTLFLLY
ncbi:MAG: isoprenylcysteine carboxylmethyltransferase family protein [Planctomycetes bacterium]|jgi:protein-S-isoprenylcysteine O-methyltransferase Ste14|nr:isoprenylcysteine carboxylmethyltransferase family protein [Planctomycetota bacterium]